MISCERVCMFATAFSFHLSMHLLDVNCVNGMYRITVHLEAYTHPKIEKNVNELIWMCETCAAFFVCTTISFQFPLSTPKINAMHLFQTCVWLLTRAAHSWIYKYNMEFFMLRLSFNSHRNYNFIEMLLLLKQNKKIKKN